MIEYSTHNIDPGFESTFLQLKECFGWQLVNSNEVYKENTYVSDITATSYGDGFIGGFMKGFTGNDGNIKVNTHTDVTNYIHITLARDTDMPNYDEIRANEERFWPLANSAEPQKPTKITAVCVIATLIIVVSVIMALVNGTSAAPWEIAVCVFVPIISALILFAVWKRYKTRDSQYYYDMDTARQILQETKQLLYTE